MREGNGEEFEWIEPEDEGRERGGEGPDIPTDEQAGNLDRIDEELRQNGVLPEEEETEEEKLEELAFSISTDLGKIGLYDPQEVTADRLKSLSEEVLEKLDIYTAETLLFETKRYMNRVKMARAPVTVERMFSKAEAMATLGNTLDLLLLNDRLAGLGKLDEIGLHHGQIMKLLNGTPEQAQTINRLYFYFYGEPRLTAQLAKMRLRSKEEDEEIDVEEAIATAQSVLNMVLEDAELGRENEQNPQTARTGWDSVAEDVYNDIVRRVDAHIRLGVIILETIRKLKQEGSDPSEGEGADEEVED